MEDKAKSTTESQENSDKSEVPKAKTPLERVREGQAKMRGKGTASGPAVRASDYSVG